mgnify:CR=1 FL=1
MKKVGQTTSELRNRKDNICNLPLNFVYITREANKEISDEALEKVCESGTDAVIVGGSDGITLDNVLQLLMRICRRRGFCILIS